MLIELVALGASVREEIFPFQYLLGCKMKYAITGAAIALLLGSVATPALATSPNNTATATANASATIIRPISVTKNADLQFGTIVAPNSGSATVNISNAGSRTTSLSTAAGAVSAADFTVGGEGASLVTVVVPATFPITSGANSLTVTTNATDTGTQTLPGSLGTPSTGLDVPVGGTITVLSTTPSAAYTGTFDVSASYN